MVKFRRKILEFLGWLARRVVNRHAIMASDYPVVCRYCGLPKHWHSPLRYNKRPIHGYEPVANKNQLAAGDLLELLNDQMGQTLEDKRIY